MNSKSKVISMKPLWSLPFIFVTISNALVFMVFEMMLPTLPLLVTKIGGGASQVGMVTGIFTFSAILIRPFAGVLAAKFNKKYLLVFGIIICSLATGAYYFSANVNILLLIRLIHGAGFGLATTYFSTIVVETIPKQRLGEGMGYFGVGETVAMSVGPMIGIMTLDLYGFQRLFLGGMSILLLAALMALIIKRKQEVQDPAKPQHIKIKLIERKVLFPAILTLLVGIAAASVMSFISLYAQEKGFEQVGLFFFVIAMASFLVRLISGKIFDRYGASYILFPAAICSIIGLSVLYMAHSNVMFFTAAIFYGFGFGSIFPVLQTLSISRVEEHQHEDAMATFFNFFDIGLGGGSLLLGSIAAAHSYQSLYIVAIIVYVIFLLLYTANVLIKRKISM